ncbi:MAG: YgiQ family radical SAM protein, partial [Clostridiales bacterium]|nr:YgiQ family radical SAM protein [Clostridiales bacterium]
MFLPTTIKEMNALGWDRPDFIFVSGEAYVDHPSFGHAIITRVLEDAGYKVAIIALPDYKNVESVKVFGAPRFGFLVSSGNMDSMVNHFTVNKKRRKKDAYAPGGKMGLRPDRATIVYSNLIKQAYKNTPIIIGGVEASLRRFAHYDYITDKVHHAILEDSGADLLVYGMGELAIVQVAKLLDRGVPLSSIKGIRGTCNFIEAPAKDSVFLDSFNDVKKGGRAFASSFIRYHAQQDAIYGKPIVQMQHRKYVVQNPPQKQMTTKQLDAIYELPYMRTYHPMYEKQGGVPALNEVEFSITSARGCFGGCSFCALHFHQGRVVVARSHESIMREVDLLIKQPKFKGIIHDVGGPTANFRKPSCEKQLTQGTCSNRQCMHPNVCSEIEADHSDYLKLLKLIRMLPEVKKVFVRSGLRYDYLLEDRNGKEFLNQLSKHHISGQLKVAPEHVSRKVLSAMGKPSFETFKKFTKSFDDSNRKMKKEQYLVPYFISSHPGSDLNAAIELACTMRDMKIAPEQVQDFYPTPGTISTCMYFTGIDPRNMKPIYVPKGEEKRMQRALLQYRMRKNHALVRKALTQAGREDL